MRKVRPVIGRVEVMRAMRNRRRVLVFVGRRRCRLPAKRQSNRRKQKAYGAERGRILTDVSRNIGHSLEFYFKVAPFLD